MPSPLQSQITSAVETLAEKLAAHPERRLDRAWEYVMKGQSRPYPVLSLGPGAILDVGGEKPAPVVSDPQERLLNALKAMTAPLDMLNPFQPVRSLGKGTGSLAASFGITLDPTIGFRPRGHRSPDEVLAAGLPDPATSGILPEIREDIETTRAGTPDWVKIAPPDMQGPFNLAHMILGQEALTLSAEEPEKFHAVMTLITDFTIAVDKNLRAWIGPDRFLKTPYPIARICECSVNLISPAMYVEHVLPHDLRLVRHWGQAVIHPCSGPHLFKVTLDNLPNMVYTEAGFVDRATAGAIGVDDALAQIGDRPIILSIGQEVPKGDEEAFIRRDLDHARSNPRLLFGYCGMHWTSKDREFIKTLHRRLDDYWENNIAPR